MNKEWEPLNKELWVGRALVSIEHTLIIRVSRSRDSKSKVWRVRIIYLNKKKMWLKNKSKSQDRFTKTYRTIMSTLNISKTKQTKRMKRRLNELKHIEKRFFLTAKLYLRVSKWKTRITSRTNLTIKKPSKSSLH